MTALYFVDAENVFNRAWYAVPTEEEGRNERLFDVGMKMVEDHVMGDVSRSRVFYCFDFPGASENRKKILPGYKANRGERSEELRAFIEYCFNELTERATGNRVLMVKRIPGFEADDVIAGLCRMHGPRLSCYVISADKDMLGLITSLVKVLRVRKGWKDAVYWGVMEFVAAYGFSPELYYDYRALKGDVTDGIAGVDRIGSVSAGRLVKTWGRLEDIYDHLDEVREWDRPIGMRLEKGREMAFLSRRVLMPVPQMVGG